MLKIIELFAGIGAPRKALELANIPHKTIWFSEIDNYAENSYRAIFNDYETLNLGDITKIDVNNLQKEEVDIIIGGWPCQDISIAGKRKGMDKDSGTRSSLLWETLKIIEFYKPKWIINENVSNVLSEKNFKNIQKYCEYLNNLGYETDYKILNAKDYGIPQKRKRIFIISKLNENWIWKFLWPTQKPLEYQFKDIVNWTILGNKEIPKLTTFHNGFIRLNGTRNSWDYCPNADEKLYPTLTTKADRTKVLLNDKYRYLTTDEMTLLMGYTLEDLKKMLSVNRKSQIQKQLGNSIVPNVLKYIFLELVKENENDKNS